MDALVSVPTYEQAAARLRRVRQVPFYGIFPLFECTRLLVQVILAYRELYPDDAVEQLARFGLAQSIAGLVEVGDVQQRIFNAVSVVVPLDDDIVEMHVSEFGIEDARIAVQPLGYTMSWDEFSEVTSDLRNLEWLYDNGWGFPMFMWTIGNDIDQETWDLLSKGLGWGMEKPDWVDAGGYFDVPKLFKSLAEAGLDVFQDAIDFAWKRTHNMLIDMDPEEPLLDDSFDADNIVWLAHEYNRAKPILERNNQAVQMLQENPALYQQISDIMAQCIKEES